MNDIVDLDADDRSTLQGRQQHAAQRVAEGRTITTLERLDHELGFALGIVSGLNDRTVRADQHFPVTVVDVGGFDVCHGRRILRMGLAARNCATGKLRTRRGGASVGGIHCVELASCL